MNVHKKDLRISRDWLGDQWISIEAKPDIVSAISVVYSSGTKLSMPSTISKDIKSGGLASSFEDLASAKPIINEEENQNLNLTASTSSDDPPKDMDWVNCEKSPSLRDNVNEDDNVDADDSCDNVDSFKGNDDDDKDGNDDNAEDDDGGKVDMKELETSGQSCKAVEMMEMMA